MNVNKLPIFADFVESIIHDAEDDAKKVILYELVGVLRESHMQFLCTADAIKPFADFDRSGYELYTPSYYREWDQAPILQGRLGPTETVSVGKHHLKHLTKIYGEII